MHSLDLNERERERSGLHFTENGDPTFLAGSVCLRVHAQHEEATGQIAPYIRVAALLLTQCSILLGKVCQCHDLVRPAGDLTLRALA